VRRIFPDFVVSDFNQVIKITLEDQDVNRFVPPQFYEFRSSQSILATMKLVLASRVSENCCWLEANRSLC
jgi:hypothetical protein